MKEIKLGKVLLCWVVGEELIRRQKREFLTEESKRCEFFLQRERCPEIKNIKKKKKRVINPKERKGNRKEKGFIIFRQFFFFFFSRCPTETAKVHDDSPSQSFTALLATLVKKTCYQKIYKLIKMVIT